ncbi:MAG: cobalt transporter CbiM [Deltaproteobacteria bacterium]|nr:MAG: cobalt transporter CbiM [Deltaproteobacteria bacterium]
MHISEGVLSAPVLISGALIAAGGVTIGLKKTENEKIPEVGVLSAAFFVGSLIHVPLGPTSVHLILNGLVGLLLGWAAFPAILVGLVFQAILFQFGGLTTLGVNTVTMALPAVVGYYIFGPFVRSGHHRAALVAAFFCGLFGVLGAAVLVAFALFWTGQSFLEAGKMVVYAHIPVMVIEGLLAMFCVAFLRKVKPELLEVKK